MRHLFKVLIVIINYVAIDWIYSPFLSTVDCAFDKEHTGQCLRRIAGGNVGLPLDKT